MSAISFGSYLSQLSEEDLTQVLSARPDVRVEPVPRGFTQLAQRLGGAGSLMGALRFLTRDMLATGRAIAVLGSTATVPSIARLLGATEHAVRDEVSRLRGVGLAWVESDVLRLPERLRDHWVDELGGGRPVVEVAARVSVEELRRAAGSWGVATGGLRKAELVARVADAMVERRALLEKIHALSPAARVRLEQLCSHEFGIMFGFAGPRGTDPTTALVDAGLVLLTGRGPEVPREVAIAVWLADDVRLTGRPEIAAAGSKAEDVRATAQAAARAAVHALAELLDEAGRASIAELKRGGVGPRERARLAKRLSIPGDVLVLWIDLAYAAGLLGDVPGGYAPTDAYSRWRAADPAWQWAVLASTWHQLEHAPLMRDVDDDKEQPPPLPLMSAAGDMRRAVLSVARAGLSVRGAGAEVDWFAPLHGYDARARDEKVAATVREAELLGVIGGDRVSELGEALLGSIDTGDDVLADTVRQCAALLPPTECTVILQSDLTAVVSGQPSAAVAELLAAAAVNEARGAAGVWRFSPASVRAALDAGWTAQDLLTELTTIADRPVPQPLEYLINDAGRKHGHVRVRRTRSCVVADEATVTEILHTRSLAKLKLTRVAPTVLSSPRELADVLGQLRAAGLSPVAEDSSGTTVVERRQAHRAEQDWSSGRPTTVVPAADLVRRLATDPVEDQVTTSATTFVLAKLNPGLDDAELALLSHAVDRRADVVISYYDNNGTHTVRQIRPDRITDRRLESFCYLRGGEREFTIAKIESVAPAH